jgi:anti-sigma B factor antagonist
VPGFAYRIDDADEVTVLVLSGEIGLESADELTAAGLDAVQTGSAEQLVIDLAAVSFIDSTGLGALVATRKAALAGGKRVAVSNVPQRITKLLEITGLTEAFPSVDG